jgi:hypothetical protein
MLMLIFETKLCIIRKLTGRRITPDSNTLIDLDALQFSSAGILEFGFTPTNPLPNWSPWLMRISHASYSAPL